MRALSPRMVDIPFVMGVDTKGDPYQTPKLIQAINVDFNSPGRVQTREGYTTLGNVYQASSQTFHLSTAEMISTFQSELVVAVGNTGLDNAAGMLVGYSPALETFNPKGIYLPVSVNPIPVISNNNVQTGQESAWHPDGIQVFAWVDSVAGVQYCVIDANTEKIIVPATGIVIGGDADTTTIKPRLVVTTSYVVLFFYSQTHELLYAKKITTSNPFLNNAPVAITSTTGVNAISSTHPNYDISSWVCNAYSDVIGLVFQNLNNATAPELTVFMVSPLTLLALTTTQISGSLAKTGTDIAVCIFPDGTPIGNPCIGWAFERDDDNTFVWLAAYDPTLTTQLHNAVVAETSDETTGNVKTITGWAVPNKTSTFNLAWDMQPGIWLVGGNFSLHTTPTPLPVNLGLASKVLLNGTQALFVAVYQDVTQSTYFLIDGDANTYLRLLPQESGGYPTTPLGLPLLTSMPSGPQGQGLVALLNQNDAAASQLVNSDPWTLTGVSAVSFELYEGYNTATLQNEMLLDGGILMGFDGQTVTEHNFFLYPEISLELNSGGSLTATTQYEYQACWAWTDAHGQIQRSAPSPGAIITTGTDQTQVTVSFNSLPLTYKVGAALEVYRTSSIPISNNANLPGNATGAPGTILYLACTSTTAGASGSTNVPILNDPTVGVLTFIDALADSTIINNPYIYTTGGVLPNAAPDACSDPTIFDNRAWVIDQTNRNTLWYSQQIVPAAPGANSNPISFSQELLYNLDSRGGDCIALASMAPNVLVAFKQSQIYYTYGIGPNELGLNSQYAPIQLAIADCGCISPKSVVVTPMGTLFQAQKGLFCVTPALTLQYIGADVENLVLGNLITSAVIVPTKNQVKFTIDTGGIIVYDYYVHQWSTEAFPAGIVQKAVSGCVWAQGNGVLTYVWLDSVGSPHVQTPGVYLDDNNFVQMTVQTGALKLDGFLNGFKRAWRAIIRGHFYSPHLLDVGVAYNDIPIVVQQDTITPIISGPYGSTSPDGQGSPYGGVALPYEFDVRLNQQEISSLQMTLQTMPPAPGTPLNQLGQACSLSCITIEYGVYPGADRIASSRTVAG